MLLADQQKEIVEGQPTHLASQILLQGLVVKSEILESLHHDHRMIQQLLLALASEGVDAAPLMLIIYIGVALLVDKALRQTESLNDKLLVLVIDPWGKA